MNPKAVPRTMIDGYLRAIRVPVDGAVRLLLPGDRPTRGKFELAIDRTDATVRALSGVVLRDEILVESAKRRRPTPPETQPVGRPRKSGRGNRREHPRQPDNNAPRQTRRSQHKRDRPPADVEPSSARLADPPPEGPPERPSSSIGQPSASPAGPPSAPSTELPSMPRRAPASTERASTPPPQLPSTSAFGPSGAVSASCASRERPTANTPDTSDDEVAGRSAEPSFDDIAARAYELYQEGRPGTAEDHWKAAEEELLARAGQPS